MAQPSVFGILPGADFSADFARGYFERHRSRTLKERARSLVLVNTAQALVRIQTALADHAPRPGILPDVRLIDEYAEELHPGQQPIHPLRRQLYLTQLVDKFLRLRTEPDKPMPPIGVAADLAQSLASLLDQFQTHGISPDGLSEIEVVGEAARHWQQSLSFVDIARKAWPEIRVQGEAGAPDEAEGRAASVGRLIDRWQTDPPDHPVVIAASTGSVGTTAALMTTVAQLPDGSVVLPGFDRLIDQSIWKSAGADHPMGPFQDFFDRISVEPSEVADWVEAARTPRQLIAAQAMRPAPVTDHWHREANRLAEMASASMRGLDLIEAETPAEEAAAIALAIRRAIAQPEFRVTVVTADGVLARRITAALDRFGIVPDDTIGTPLANSVPGVLMGLTLTATRSDAGALEFAALLQHPLVRPGRLRSEHLALARAYERRALRKLTGRGKLPDDPKADQSQTNWLNSIRGALDPLASLRASAPPLVDCVAALRKTLEILTDPGDGPVVWDDDAGVALRQFFDDLKRHASVLGDTPIRDLSAVLSTLIQGRQLRPKPRRPHPRVRIIGTREARFEAADVTILAGLNDGIWPEMPDPGPWLSRPMYPLAGLPPPERTVGLSAHDFLQAICRGRVIVSRSLRADGSPTVASRWLVRLETLITGIGAGDEWAAARERGATLTRFARQLASRPEPVPSASRPAPVPPRAAMPRTLPVTQIETLVRDAYAVYARYVLGLRALDPLSRRADVRDRGQLLHTVMEAFVTATDPWPGPDSARQTLMRTAEDALTAANLPADLRRAWRGRIDRFADWLIAGEARRRAAATPLSLENAGTVALQVEGETINITAIADRIDQLGMGGGAIYDYKSGLPPTDKQIKLRFNQQLHVAGLILRSGGFRDVPALTPESGTYIGLTGGREGGRETQCDDLSGELDQFSSELTDLLAAFLRGAPWVSRGRPDKITFSSDYDHLARTAEWSGEDGS